MARRKRTLTAADQRAAERVRALWKQYRDKHPGMTQERAASLAGMGQSAFSQFLLGSVPMRVTPVVKFAALFGVQPSEIRSDLPELAIRGARAAEAKPVAQEPAEAAYRSEPSDEALEIARMWQQLPAERRQWFRDLMALEAIVAKHYPWLMFGRPKRESYNEYERRVESDLLRLAARLQGEKS